MKWHIWQHQERWFVTGPAGKLKQFNTGEEAIAWLRTQIDKIPIEENPS